MKKVALIGDSIRMSYCSRVAELLSDCAEVWSPEENCRFAKYTLWEINNWMRMGGNGKPDIIHWNNGIWDAFKISDRVNPFTSVDEYVRDMLLILGEMKKSGAKVIFATTTPVKKQLVSTSTDRINQYNDAILNAFRNEDVIINDLNATISADIDGYIGDDCLHLNEKGVEVAAQEVAEFIRQYL